MYHQMMSIILQRGLNNSLEGLLFPHTGLQNFKIRVFASTGVSLWRRAVHRSTTWKHLSKPFIRPGWPVLRKLWHIETTPFKKFMTNLRKWKKLTPVPGFPTSTVKPKKPRRQTQMSFVREASVSFFPSWSLTQLPTHFLEFYWFRMLSCIFLATDGYDNARLSDDIHRGSRQIHDQWLRSTCPSCTKSQNGPL